MIRLLVLWILLALPAQSEEVVLGLSHDQVAITATFDGSELLIFGAVKRDSPIPEGATLDVVMTLAGPSSTIDIRRKSREMGIWVNTDAVRITRVPSFYAVASTGPLSEILSDSADSQYRISIDTALLSPSITSTVKDTSTFIEALIRLRMEDGLFQVREGGIMLDEQTLFRTSLALPASLVEGQYATRIFLLRNGAVVDFYETLVVVQKVGLERWLYLLSQQKPLAYGILSLVIAIAAGWLASAVFRVFQR